MSQHNTNDKRDRTKDKHPAKDNPNEHGEIPRTRDDSEDHKKDPWQDKGK
ncbi:hypothetical protein [Pantoea sp. BAV 3049]|nr:hypothetical protein [Pantoea sp. BAV 3049]